jgi:predicted peptidase
VKWRQTLFTEPFMRNHLFSVLGSFLSGNLSANDGGKLGEIINKSVLIDSLNYDYQLYTPPQIDSSDKLPVIIFLHGIRERGSGGGIIPANEMIRNFIKQYLKQIPAIVLLPQCRPNKYWSDPLMDKMVMRAFDQTVEEFEANVDRVYLIGVSMGGYGVWHFALQYPRKFAALVSICGGSPILTGDRFSPIAKKIGKTPAWIFHGADDRIVPVTESRELVKALKENQGEVKYSEFPNVGHNVWLNVLGEKDLLPWLLAQTIK